MVIVYLYQESNPMVFEVYVEIGSISHEIRAVKGHFAFDPLFLTPTTNYIIILDFEVCLDDF